MTTYKTLNQKRLLADILGVHLHQKGPYLCADVTDAALFFPHHETEWTLTITVPIVIDEPVATLRIQPMTLTKQQLRFIHHEEADVYHQQLIVNLPLYYQPERDAPWDLRTLQLQLHIASEWGSFSDASLTIGASEYLKLNPGQSLLELSLTLNLKADCEKAVIHPYKEMVASTILNDFIKTTSRHATHTIPFLNYYFGKDAHEVINAYLHEASRDEVIRWLQAGFKRVPIEVQQTLTQNAIECSLLEGLLQDCRIPISFLKRSIASKNQTATVIALLFGDDLEVDAYLREIDSPFLVLYQNLHQVIK